MNESSPQRKVVAGGIAGAISSIGVWALEQFGGVTIPAEIALATYTVVLFILQYAVPNAPGVSNA